MQNRLYVAFAIYACALQIVILTIANKVLFIVAICMTAFSAVVVIFIYENTNCFF